jgi:hypothetical protein
VEERIMSAGIMATDGVGETQDAFQAAIDAETPSSSRNVETRARTQKEPIDDLFPNKELDRSEESAEEQEEPAEEGDEEELEEQEVDDEEEDEEEPPQPGDLNLEQVIKTTIDGEEVELPLGEAIRSGMREKTFHKYMSQLDLAVRETNQQRVNLSGHYQQHMQRVQEFDAFINEMLPPPDWPALFRQDPTRAMAMKVEYEAVEEKRAKVREHLQYAQQWQQQEQMKALHQFANANRAQLGQIFPEWKDEKVWKRDHDSMRRTAHDVGYSDGEINQLYDARAVVILNLASKYLRLMANKPKPVKQGFTATKRARATPSRNVQNAFDRVERRLNRGSSKDQLKATFERMLESEG